ncbi:hypothetical protein ANRL4_05530 [Anaerolineae bacterium]|nr:hypothetical protein ANRL4_05530 [Anaerolineae bacterium]
MQQPPSTQVSRIEWRWVIIFGGLLVAITLLPYAWAFSAVGGGYTFTGILYNPLDSGTYLSKIQQGMDGNWLYTFTHTSEQHVGALVHFFYLLLGQIARILGFSPLVIFHLARLAFSFMMYIAIYHLGSTIWTRIRPRRLFFGILAVGSGLGWFSLIMSAGKNFPADLNVPESIPFHATLMNPHFPFSIALIALLASIYIRVFRPGFEEDPNLTNGGGGVILSVIILCLMQPQAWLPFAAGLGGYLVVTTIRSRSISRRDLSWALMAVLPALPILIYYAATITTNEPFRIWNQQNQTPSPSLDGYILGFGLPLLVAVPSIWRAFRRFERDGDRLMLIWLGVNAILLYAPFNLQRRLAIGMIIPIAYFAVRALEDFWFHVIAVKWRGPSLIALFVFMIPSNVMVFGLPLVGIVDTKAGVETGLVLQPGYADSIRWIEAQPSRGVVVLAPPLVSLWIPAFSHQKVVYGHPFETLYAEQKEASVKAWYKGARCDQDGQNCAPISESECHNLIDAYQVSYILLKAPEDNDPEPGDAAFCAGVLNLTTPIQTFGKVSIYKIE